MLNLKSIFQMSAVCAGIVLTATSAHADNLILNPNFVATPANAYPGYGPVASWTAPTLSGPFTYLSGSNTSSGPFFNNGTLPAGDNTVGFIQVYSSGSTNVQTDSLRQTFATTVGQLYTISYLLDSRAGNAAPNVNVEVLNASSTFDYFFANTITSGNFVQYTGSFVATSASETLAFIANLPAGSSDSTLLISDVSVSTVASAATPEPSSLILLATGALGVLGATRRRLRSA